MSKKLGLVRDFHLIGMHEIGVVARLDAPEHRMREVDDQVVPAHVRNLERLVRRLNPAHLAVDPAEAVNGFVLVARARH